MWEPFEVKIEEHLKKNTLTSTTEMEPHTMEEGSAYNIRNEEGT